MSGVCVDPERVKTWDACCTALGVETETRMKACAKRVWARWQNRDSEGWCEHCGKGGKELKRCRGCRMAKIWWCCREHQLAGWSLHKHTSWSALPLSLGSNYFMNRFYNQKSKQNSRLLFHHDAKNV
ncbi:hypothetical protein LSUB1_G008067 [Lachnellula subtilissima]|uniref:MYND-type domain-containing protein n=1 Tax=Lachnellula subtilissima TaxID=602034 RepID=A0A8H8RDA8_9HELO|nr:hypothetical protein LSUB1_G008067 [Lachnellula subtilissima]